MSAGCERLPGSKGKGEDSRPSLPRPPAAFDPLSLDCLGLSASRPKPDGLTRSSPTPQVNCWLRQPGTQGLGHAQPSKSTALR